MFAVIKTGGKQYNVSADEKVTIGRIEVTAVSAAPDRKQKAVSRRPAMSLEEYLARRQGERA